MQITLSEFHLSGFVILVFSKQKGLTVVFRNDPLESLKVSSTFDSIPFVRDFLQKAIEDQLRQLFMDELPAIIHRLSLRLWVPEYKTIMDREELEQTQGVSQSPSQPPQLNLPPQDPFLNPPSDPVDSAGHVLTTSEIGALSLDSSVEMHSLFSQKNLLRLAALADSQRTLSLFTPSVAEVAFRACASVNPDIAEGCTPSIAIPISGSGLGLHGYAYGYGASPALSRTTSQSQMLMPPATPGAQLSIPDTASAVSGSYSSRQSISGWSGYGLNLGAGRHPHTHGKHGANKKKKRRVVDLRKKTTSEAESKEKEAALEREKEEMKMKLEDRELKMPMTGSEAATPSISVSPSSARDAVPEETQKKTVEVITPKRRSTEKTEKSREIDAYSRTPARLYTSDSSANINDFYMSDRQSHTQAPPPQLNFPSISSPIASSAPLSPYTTDPNAAYSSYYGYNPYAYAGSSQTLGNGNNSGILEQALMMKMAGELARRMHPSKGAEGSDKSEGIPPPPYRQ